MNSFEITKIAGAIFGSMLVFLLIQTAAHAIYDTHSEEVAFAVEVEDAGGGEATEEEAVDVPALVAAADPAKGEAVFKKCQACHKLEAGANAVGPSLHGIIGRAVGAEAGFSYSEAMVAHGGNWTPEEIFNFIASPKKAVPGTKMAFAGLPKPEDRANLIAYLEQASN